MSNRRLLILAIGLAAASTLLASVTASTVRASCFSTLSSRPDRLSRNFVIPPQHASRFRGTTVIPQTVQVVDFDSENEEQTPIGASLPIGCAFDPPISSPMRPTPDLTADRLARAYYPLRC